MIVLALGLSACGGTEEMQEAQWLIQCHKQADDTCNVPGPGRCVPADRETCLRDEYEFCDTCDSIDSQRCLFLWEVECAK